MCVAVRDVASFSAVDDQKKETKSDFFSEVMIDITHVCYMTHLVRLTTLKHKLMVNKQSNEPARSGPTSSAVSEQNMLSHNRLR